MHEGVKSGISFGSALAITISWSKWHSILWAMIHGVCLVVLRPVLRGHALTRDQEEAAGERIKGTKFPRTARWREGW